MRVRLLTGLAAASLAVSIAVAGAPAPAQAAETKQAETKHAETKQQTAAASAQLFAIDWVSLGIAAAGYLFGGGGGGGNPEAAIQEIKAAIEASKTEIIRQIDALAAAEVEACLEAHTIEFLNIDFMDSFTLSQWAQAATECATRASAFAGAVQSPQAADKIGFVVGPIFAIVYAARARANLPNGIDLVMQSQIRAYEAVVSKLTPSCNEVTVREPDIDGRPLVVEIQYTCTAYNGDMGYGTEMYYRGKMVIGPLDRPAVQMEATRNTSRPVAAGALPRLRDALP